MASTINTESMVESVINRLLNELYISGLDRITILRVFPSKPIIPVKKENNKCEECSQSRLG